MLIIEFFITNTMNRMDIARQIRNDKISLDEIKILAKKLNISYIDRRKTIAKIRKELNISRKDLCIFEEGCHTRANYGYEDRIGLFCEDHHINGTMVISINKRTELHIDNYRIQLIEKFRDGKIEEVAKELKIKFYPEKRQNCGRIIKRKLNIPHMACCIQEDCTKRCIFGNEGHRALFCKKHIVPNMIRLVHNKNKCSVEDCNKVSKFRFEDGSTRRCEKHKLDEMVKLAQICEHEDCTIRANFGYKVDNIGRYCSIHRQSDMVYVYRVYCKEKGCTIGAGFGYPDTKVEEYCFAHSRKGMISFHKRCEDCDKTAAFGFIAENIVRWCNDHKTEGAISLRKPPCSYEGCDLSASFMVENGDGKRFCSYHKPDSASYVGSRKCQIDGCKLRATFGYINSSRTMCKEHRLPDMIDPHRKYCEYISCVKSASFGLASDNIKMFCYTHKTSDMICLGKKLCEFESCKSEASYGLVEDNKVTRCHLHKLTDMKKLGVTVCEQCDNFASYGFEVDGILRYCYDHKLEGSIHLLRKRCDIDNCFKRVDYGFYHCPTTRCSEHKLPDQVRYKYCNPKCHCNNKAIYGKEKPTACIEHKAIDDILIVKISICICCYLEIPMNSIQSDTCQECYDYLNNPNHPKAKENKIGRLLIRLEVNLISHDRIIDTQCNKYRPDYVIDNNHNIIIVEVDEDKHSSKAYKCEINRMKEIANCFGGTPVIFIRFNPDSYRVEGKSIKSYYGRERF